MYAICRVGKIKSQSQLSQAQSHNLRQRETFNADPLKKSNNEILYGSEFVRDDVNKRLEETGVKVRKDSVLCAEMILTASPEFFNTNASFKEWKNENLKFLKEKYGDNLINVIIHNDEQTPHLHAIITPIISDEQNNNRLSMKDYLSGKKNLRELQTDYAKSMEKFGLNRGIEKSVAKHQDIKSFYSSIEDVKYIAQETKEDFKNDLKVKINIKTPEPTGKIFKTISQEDAKKSTIENLQEYKKKVNEKIHPMHEGIVNLSIENNRLKTENTKLREVAAKLNRDNEISKKRDQKFDHMRKLCPDEHQKLQQAYKNKLNEIEQKKKQDEELKLKNKLELEQKRKEELAKRPKGESSLNEQHKNQSRPEPEEPQYSRPRPRF